MAKALKRLLILCLAICVSAFFGVFAAACDKDDKEPDKEQSGNENNNGGNENNNGNNGNNGNNENNNGNNGNNGNNENNNGNEGGNGNKEEEEAPKYVYTNDAWNAAATEGGLDAEYTYSYSIVSGAGTANDVVATVTLSEDGTVTVIAHKDVNMGANELGYGGTYKVYEDHDNAPPLVTYVLISELKLLEAYDGEMGNSTGDAPFSGFIDWSDENGNAIISLNDEDNTCAPLVESAATTPDEGDETPDDGETVTPPEVTADPVILDDAIVTDYEVTFTGTVQIRWRAEAAGSYMFTIADETQDEATLKTYGFYVQIGRDGDWTYAVSPKMGFVGTGINLTEDLDVTIIIEAPEAVTGEVTLSISIAVNDKAGH